MTETTSDLAGRRAPGGAQWEAAKAEFLAGASGPQACMRHGVSLSRFRERARAEGWRRADQPPPRPDDLNAGATEEEIEWAIEIHDAADMAEAARQHAAMALARGRLAEAQGWTRLWEAMTDRAARDAEQRRWRDLDARGRPAAVPRPAPAVAAPATAPARTDSADSTDSSPSAPLNRADRRRLARRGAQPLPAAPRSGP